MDQQCTQRYLAEVSKHLRNWELLGPYLLELTPAEQETIARNHPGNYEVQKQKLLEKWRAKYGPQATHRVLIAAILKMGNVNLAHEACEILRHLSSELTCSVSSSSMPIANASPAIVAYQRRLKVSYETETPIMVVEWPPPPALKFISLALIKTKKVERGKITNEYIQSTIHGNIDDIRQEKEPIKLEQLFDLDSEKRKFILIEGAPGSGKSTLLWQICQKWQSGELFQQFSLVLLVLLRDTGVHKALCLADILPYVPEHSSKCTPAEYRKNVASEIEDSYGEQVLIMLDGWDEAPVKLRQKGSLIHDIIAASSKYSIQKATVVVSSRPSASNDIRKYASSRVEVIGFTKERRNEYIRETIPGNEQAALKLIKEIDNFPELAQNCHLPLNTVIITHIFVCSKHELPSTYCRIITTLALNCLLRHVQKSTEYGNSFVVLESFEKLPDDIGRAFLKLCKIAYNGIKKEKYSFTREDFIELAQSASTPQVETLGLLQVETLGLLQVETLGLLQAVHSLVATGSSTVYHFLHLSLQELCAAHYIASLSNPETKHVKALGKMVYKEDDGSNYLYFKARFVPVCKFYSALTHLKHKEVAIELFFNIFGQEHYDFEYDNHIIELQCGVKLQSESFLECLLEAENPELVQEMISTYADIKYYGQSVAPIIAMANKLEKVVCHLNNPEILKALTGKPNLKELIFEDVSFSSIESLDNLKILLQTCPKLERLVLDSYKFGDTEMARLAEAVKLSATTELTIIYSAKGEALTPESREFRFHGPKAFAEALSCNSSLTTLNMYVSYESSGSGFQCDDRAWFFSLKASSLTKISIIQSVTEPFPKPDTKPKLSDTSVGRALLSGDLVELADILGLNTPPTVDKTLHIHIYGSACIQIDFTNQCFEHLRFSASCDIEQMLFSTTCIGPETMEKLSTTITAVTVKKLDLQSQKIKDEGVQFLAQVINSTSLESLNISYCEIGDVGMAALSSSLRHNTTLKHLNAGGNEFGDEGIIKLAEALNQTSLEELDISHCNIGDNGILALAQALSTNTSLETLNAKTSKAITTQTQDALERALLQNTSLTSLSVNIPCNNKSNTEFLLYQQLRVFDLKIYELTYEATQRLREDPNFYSGIKNSKLITSIVIDRTTSLGEALWSGNMEQAAEILQLNQPPQVVKILVIYMSGNSWSTFCIDKTVTENDKGLKIMRDIYNDSASWSDLYELNFEGKILGSVGACLLAEILNETQLQKLDVRGCSIGEEGIVALSMELRTNTTLKQLSIGGNWITERGQTELTKALTTNKTLVELDVRDYTFYFGDPIPMPLYLESFETDHRYFLLNVHAHRLNIFLTTIVFTMTHEYNRRTGECNVKSSRIRSLDEYKSDD